MTESLWCLSKRGVCPRESSTHGGKLIHELGRGSGSNVRKNRINPSGVFFCERSVQVVVIRIVFKIAFTFLQIKGSVSMYVTRFPRVRRTASFPFFHLKSTG